MNCPDDIFGRHTVATPSTGRVTGVLARRSNAPWLLGGRTAANRVPDDGAPCGGAPQPALGCLDDGADDLRLDGEPAGGVVAPLGVPVSVAPIRHGDDEWHADMAHGGIERGDLGIEQRPSVAR